MAWEWLDCLQNHKVPQTDTPLQHGNRIGKIAGYACFSLFAEQGFGVDQSIIDAINDSNEDYQQNFYLPRMEEAREILAWFAILHEGDDENPFECPGCGVTHSESEFLDMRDYKRARLAEIDAEIEEEWDVRCAAIRGMIGEAKYHEFIVWGLQQGG